MTYNVTFFRGTVFVIFNEKEGPADNKGFWASDELKAGQAVPAEYMILGPAKLTVASHQELAAMVRQLFPPLAMGTDIKERHQRQPMAEMTKDEVNALTKKISQATAGTMYFVIDGQVLMMTRESSLKALRNRTPYVKFRPILNNEVVSFGINERFVRDTLEKLLLRFEHPSRDAETRQLLTRFIAASVSNNEQASNVNAYNIGDQCQKHQMNDQMWIETSIIRMERAKA